MSIEYRHLQKVVWIHSNICSRAIEMCFMWTVLGIVKPSAGAQSARVSLLVQVPNNILPQAVLQLVVPNSLVPNYWVHVMSGYAVKISWFSAIIRFQIYRVPRYLKTPNGPMQVLLYL